MYFWFVIFKSKNRLLVLRFLSVLKGPKCLKIYDQTNITGTLEVLDGAEGRTEAIDKGLIISKANFYLILEKAPILVYFLIFLIHALKLWYTSGIIWAYEGTADFLFNRFRLVNVQKLRVCVQAIFCNFRFWSFRVKLYKFLVTLYEHNWKILLLQ